MPRVRRSRDLRIYLTEDEYATLVARSRAAGSTGLGAYIRAAALGQPVPVAAASVPRANVAQYADLGRAAGNLNQLARHLNVGNIITDRDLLPVLRQLSEELHAVRRALLGVGG